MKTLFRSQELWDLVENGFEDKKDAQQIYQALRENRKKDAKALFFIQQALDDNIFSRIAAATTAKQAWDTLKQEYLGDQKVVTVKLQTLCRTFELLEMKEKDFVQEYLSRVSEIVNSMRSYGETITDATVVKKVLRTLLPTFNPLVTAIEETKDFTSYSFDELMSSLLAYEDRMGRSIEKVEEKALQVKGELSKQKFHTTGSRGRGRSGFRGLGRGNDRGRGQFV